MSNQNTRNKKLLKNPSNELLEGYQNIIKMILKSNSILIFSTFLQRGECT